ncbi:MAG: M56 family metallopeptidase [Bryobacteraceae bacterium]
MITAVSWFTPDTIRALGWSLVHFLWQGAALALLLYVVTAFTRTALARYTAAVSTLGLMACCPIFTFFVLRHQPESIAQAAVLKQMMGPVRALTASTGALPISARLPFGSIDWLSWFVSLWFLGVLLFGIRALGGWILLERLHREKIEPLSTAVRQRCLALQRRIGLSRSVRYLQSRLIDSPGVVGWFRPAVLLPVTALTGLSAEQLEAVILHELAHIKRFDPFVNLFQIAAETVLFYHPAIWWVNRCIRAERENCCDDIAVTMCGDACDYARALTLMETWRAAPALVLAANSASLKSRISRLLGFETVARSVPRGGLAAIGLLCAAGALVAGTFNVSVSRVDDFDSGSFEQSSTAGPPAPPAPAPPPPCSENCVHNDARRAASPPPAPAAPRAPAAPPSASEPPAPDPPDSPQAGPPEPPAPKTSYIDGLQSAGIKNLSVDDLIALKIQGVTPEYVRQMRSAGIDPKVHNLVDMKIQGITPEYVREIQAIGLEPAVHDLIDLKIQGITPGYIRDVRAAGLDPNLHELIDLKIQGITPEFIQKVHRHGFTNLSVRQLVEIKIANVF